MQIPPEQQYHRMFAAIKIITDIEHEQALALDARSGTDKVTHASFETILNITTDVILRNIFPRATKEQRAILEALMSTAAVDLSTLEAGARFDVENGRAMAKEEAARMFPLDEVNPLQRLYLTTFLLK